jgi:5'-3' exoribonuclease 2
MAIDGVAPRAKMNQQRSRRFRSAKEAREKAELEKKIYDEFVEEGKDPSTLGIDPNKKAFDSNVITPGTPFMEQLAKGLRYYIADRINHSSGWANVNQFKYQFSYQL